MASRAAEPRRQLTESWDAVGMPLQRREAHYTYNSNGQKLSLTGARGFRAEMTPDGHGRQKRWIFPSKTSPEVADQSDYEEYGYDAGGNRTSLIVAVIGHLGAIAACVGSSSTLRPHDGGY